MELVTKLEKQISKWLKNVPHLPTNAQKWLADNIWWIAVVGAIVAGIAFLFSLGALFSAIALLGAVGNPVYRYYITQGVTAWSLVTAIVGLVFLAVQALILGLAVNPLKAKQHKGWRILFIAWLVSVVAVVIDAVLTLSPISFIFSLIFGAVGIAIGAYLIFEIRERFIGSTAKKAKKS